MNARKHAGLATHCPGGAHVTTNGQHAVHKQAVARIAQTANDQLVSEPDWRRSSLAAQPL